MDTELFRHLHDSGVISNDELTAVQQTEQRRLVSLYTDLHALLYSGILMLMAGIGILIYKNIDTIGHAVIVALVGLGSAGCLFWCFRNANNYSHNKVEPPNQWFDYIALLGTMLMTTFFGYLQFQYHVFGMRWGLATFIPMVLLFGLAYYFDHKGILSLAITALGAWLGVAIDPVDMIRSGQLSSEDYVVHGVLLGVVLTAAGIGTLRVNVKAHFAAVYSNFGLHVLMISLVSAMLVSDHAYAVWFLGVAAGALWFFNVAVKTRSFYYLLFASLYGYAGFSVLLVRLILSADGAGVGAAYFMLMYFIASAIGLAMWLKHYNKKLGEAEDVQ